MRSPIVSDFDLRLTLGSLVGTTMAYSLGLVLLGVVPCEPLAVILIAVGGVATGMLVLRLGQLLLACVFREESRTLRTYAAVAALSTLLIVLALRGYSGIDLTLLEALGVLSPIVYGVGAEVAIQLEPVHGQTIGRGPQ